MKITSERSTPRSGLSSGQIAVGLFGFLAPVLTFLLAVSSLSETVKIFILIVLAVGYSLICFWSFQKSLGDKGDRKLAPLTTPAVHEEGLHGISEASEFFGSSLKPSDLFRLVSHQVAHVLPFSGSALFVQTEAADSLKVVQADGRNSEALLNVEMPTEQGIAGMAWLSLEVASDADLKLERIAMPAVAIEGISSAVAIPLMHDQQPFAVLVLYMDQPLKVDSELHTILHAIGERVAPLFLSSIAFERSTSNALTDAVTKLPNERAFFMVLENQLAESQRFRSERPLTVMTVDIKNFAEANQNFGFEAGNRILDFTAALLSSQLRKMDFLSRSSNDEFLIILPTASEKFADEIAQRIKDRFTTEVFAVSETEEMKVWLHFGWATFWQDGETAEQLLQTARIRKQQAKAEEPSKVLWFPKEYVN